MRFLRILFILIVLFLLNSSILGFKIFFSPYSNGINDCSSLPLKSQSNVYFVQMEGVMSDLFHLFDSEQYIGFVEANEYLKYSCPSGSHIFLVVGNSRVFLEANLKEGCSYIVLIKHIKGNLKLFPLTGEDRDNFLKSIKLIKNNPPNYFPTDYLKRDNLKPEQFIRLKDKYEKKKIQGNLKQILPEMCIQNNEMH